MNRQCKASPGWVRRGPARQARRGQDKFWRGQAWHGEARQARPVRVGSAPVRRGRRGGVCSGLARSGRLGGVRCVRAW
jgi:hypothetical protein